jgi:hypothetical protein
LLILFLNVYVILLTLSSLYYRDLATRNVLLRNLPNGSLRCLIADMGLARLHNREETYQQTKAATAPLKVRLFAFVVVEKFFFLNHLVLL